MADERNDSTAKTIVEYKEIAVLGISIEQLSELGKENWRPCCDLRRIGDRPNYDGWNIPNPPGLYTGLLWRERRVTVAKETPP